MSTAKTELQKWLADAATSPPDSLAAVTEQTVGQVNEAVANAIVNALNQDGYDWQEAGHVVCDFLASAARAMQEFQDQFEHAVASIVSGVLTARRRERRSLIPEPVAAVAAQAAVNALMKLSVIRHFDDLLRATRILAVMWCPAPERHRAVVLYCLNPLEQAVLADATRQQLMDSLPRGWMTPRTAPIS